MRIIGITGQSGSGKGHLSMAFSALGYIHLDADKIYHRLLSESSELREELVRAFGEDIEHNGKIDRSALGKKVLGKKNGRRLKKLNRITHKYVCREYIRLILEHKASGTMGIVIDAPLLIEARLDKLCDTTVLVTADRSLRIERIVARDSIDRFAAERRIDSQKDISFYSERCEHIFINNGTESAADFAAHIDKLLSGGAN